MSGVAQRSSSAGHARATHFDRADRRVAATGLRRRDAGRILTSVVAVGFIVVLGLALLVWKGVVDDPLPAGKIARVAGVHFDHRDLEAYLGGGEAEFESLAGARRAVDRFVGHQVLLLAAQERDEPVEGLLERLVEQRGYPEPVTEAEVRARYERDRHLYQREREVRIAYAGIPLAAGSGDSGAPSSPAALRELADQILVRARLHPAREELALWIPRSEPRAYALESGPWPCVSAEHSRPQQGQAAGPPPSLIAAACELREGRLTPVIETEDGFFVAKVRRRTRAWKTPYARVARTLREDLERERFEAARRRESERLRERARIRLGPEAIASLVVPGAPSSLAVEEPAGPPRPPGLSEDS
jgi:hypothetical protein